MILYFSATGNGKYIAEQIAAATDEKCISIIDCIRGDKYFFRNEKIMGIVVPTYFWRLPGIVARYLEKLRLENCGYTFFLASYGTTTGLAGSMAKEIMARNGQFLMPVIVWLCPIHGRLYLTLTIKSVSNNGWAMEMSS